MSHLQTFTNCPKDSPLDLHQLHASRLRVRLAQIFGKSDVYFQKMQRFIVEFKGILHINEEILAFTYLDIPLNSIKLTRIASSSSYTKEAK